MKRDLFEHQGTIKTVRPYSVVIGDAELKYSNDCTKERFNASHEGQEALVKVDRYKGKLYIVDILSPVAKELSTDRRKPDAKTAAGNSYRGRFSPEELELEKEKGARISRSNALTHAIEASPEGTSVEELLAKADRFAAFILTGKIESSAAPVAPPKTEGQSPSGPSVKTEAVKALWQKAEKAGWTKEEFERLSTKSFKKASDQLSATEIGPFTKVLEAMLKAAIKVA